MPAERQAGRKVTPGQGSLTAPWIGGEDLSPVKARILLMLALAVTTDLREIQRMFSESRSIERARKEVVDQAGIEPATS